MIYFQGLSKGGVKNFTALFYSAKQVKSGMDVCFQM